MSGLRHVGIDFGGTNIRIYEVDAKTGEIPELMNGGKSRDLQTRDIKTNSELTDVIKKEIKRYYPGRLSIGISSAGVVDEDKLIVRYSPNSLINGKITFPRDLAEIAESVSVTNDMRAALAGTVLWGDGRDKQNVVVATYSSGHNVAKAENKKIVTQAEFGHQSYRLRISIPTWADRLECGCGGISHLEPYVSGNGAVMMLARWCDYTGSIPADIFESAIDNQKKEDRDDFAKKLGKLSRKERGDYRDLLNFISARDIYEAFKNNPRGSPQLEIQRIQSEAIADSFGMMVSSYNPVDMIVCMGGQTKDWDSLFAPAIDRVNKHKSNYFLGSLPSPKIVKNSVRKLGVVGAVAYNILGRR